MSLYTLDKELSAEMLKVFENLPKEPAVKEFRKCLDSLADAICSNLLDYMHDEYILQFEEISIKQARSIVESLLRGENLERFGLRIQQKWNSSEFFAYDGEKIRAALIRDFKDDIVTAEMLELKSENERLNKDLAYYRNRQS